MVLNFWFHYYIKSDDCDVECGQPWQKPVLPEYFVKLKKTTYSFNQQRIMPQDAAADNLNEFVMEFYFFKAKTPPHLPFSPFTDN